MWVNTKGGDLRRRRTKGRREGPQDRLKGRGEQERTQDGGRGGGGRRRRTVLLFALFHFPATVEKGDRINESWALRLPKKRGGGGCLHIQALHTRSQTQNSARMLYSGSKDPGGFAARLRVMVKQRLRTTSGRNSKKENGRRI